MVMNERRTLAGRCVRQTGAGALLLGTLYLPCESETLVKNLEDTAPLRLQPRRIRIAVHGE